MDQHIGTLYQIEAAGQKTNSYKFALWRALTRLAPSTDEAKPLISKSDLAPLFVEYYWPLEVRYHLRQGIDPDKDPIVMKKNSRTGDRKGSTLATEINSKFFKRTTRKNIKLF